MKNVKIYYLFKITGKKINFEVRNIKKVNNAYRRHFVLFRGLIFANCNIKWLTHAFEVTFFIVVHRFKY